MALSLGILTRFVPSESPLGPAARIFDSLAPWLVTLASVGCVGIWATRGRWTAAVLFALCCTGAAGIAVLHRGLSLPVLPGSETHLSVLFFNVLGNNAAYADRIVSAALEADVDVMVFAEAEAMYDALPRIARTHTVLTRCEFEDCPLLIASRVPSLRAWQLTLNPIWERRYGVAELSLDGDRRLFLSTAHLAKPWFSGVSEMEYDRLAAQWDWLDGPVLAVGDFNAAPWSRPLSDLLTRTGYRAVRRPPGTWPVEAGRWGVPIDLALVHGGARITGVTPFGAELNSNHRGIVVGVHLPDQSDPEF